MKRKYEKYGSDIYSPRYLSNYERENNVAQCRLEKGLTQRELADIIGVSINSICLLELGYTSPMAVYKDGSSIVKKWVKKLVDALDVSISDLFPREICDISRAGLTNEQIIDIFHGSLQNNDTGELKKQIDKVLKTIGKRESEVIIMHYFEDCDFRYIAKKFGVTYQRISGIHAKALREMRHPKRSKLIREWCPGHFS